MEECLPFLHKSVQDMDRVIMSDNLQRSDI